MARRSTWRATSGATPRAIVAPAARSGQLRREGVDGLAQQRREILGGTAQPDRGPVLSDLPLVAADEGLVDPDVAQLHGRGEGGAGGVQDVAAVGEEWLAAGRGS